MATFHTFERMYDPHNVTRAIEKCFESVGARYTDVIAAFVRAARDRDVYLMLQSLAVGALRLSQSHPYVPYLMALFAWCIACSKMAYTRAWWTNRYPTTAHRYARGADAIAVAIVVFVLAGTCGDVRDLCVTVFESRGSVA